MATADYITFLCFEQSRIFSRHRLNDHTGSLDMFTLFREEVQERATSTLVGEWVSSADSSLLDKVVCGLLQYLFLQPRTCKLGLSLAKRIAKSPLASKHPLLLGIKSLIKKKGEMQCTCTHTLWPALSVGL